mmetsp:Transcript_14877/g.30049  ORF Transcript_14877/g.30049 Transcript_14877/m.30049 type:complete len:83 (-) Transcript_14877:1129-1377(-)
MQSFEHTSCASSVNLCFFHFFNPPFQSLSEGESGLRRLSPTGESPPHAKEKRKRQGERERERENYCLRKCDEREVFLFFRFC